MIIFLKKEIDNGNNQCNKPLNFKIKDNKRKP